MIITASQRFSRQAPLKVRLVANTVRKMPLEAAIRQLAVMDRTASILILKVVRQAIANAVNNQGIKFEELQLKNILVDSASSYKRFRAVSRGRAHSILKRSSHVTVQLEKPELLVAVPTTKAVATEPKKATKETRPAKKAAPKSKPKTAIKKVSTK
ncbi:MAG: 50S ribosomal protein L22 [Candidatus Pacebacteria bacterium CG_4_10_14_0_8_um_filter_43_12]|nr:MAG: 50S ribosomal protein L22 [Candidatus Pacebacteria bacterium CG10_big_fil_rev_8_21_14_0_10_44_11]PIY79553.1 MAG: 50S ribosomal protein L22 [Candidatus Pacebacteria bacterium CG_4_10_14_0_8_um_filter_43_12]